MSNRFGSFCRTRLDGFIESKLEARTCPTGFVYFITENGTELWVWKVAASDGSIVFRVDIRPFITFVPSWPSGARLQRLVLDSDGSNLYFNSSRIVKVATANGIPDAERVIWESFQGGLGGLDIAPDGDLRWGPSRVSADSGITIWGNVSDRTVSAGLDNTLATAITVQQIPLQLVQKFDPDGVLLFTHFLPVGPSFNAGNNEGVAVADNGNIWISYETRFFDGLNFFTRYRERMIDGNGVLISDAASDGDLNGSAFGIYPTESRTGVTWFYRPGVIERFRQFDNQNAEVISTTDIPTQEIPLAAHRGISDHFVGRPNSVDVARISSDYLTDIWSIPISISIDGIVRSIGSHNA